MIFPPIISSPVTPSAPSEDIPSLAAFTLRVNVSVEVAPIVMVEPSPPLIPFLQLPLTLSVPSPVIRSVPLDLSLIPAPSKSSFSVPSSEYSSSGFSLSVSVLVPEITIVVSVLSLLIVIGAPSEFESVKFLSISVTPVVPFLTFTEPSEHEPVIIYVPD